MKYRKKPVEIEAFELTTSFLNFPEWANEALTGKVIISVNMGKFYNPQAESFILIKTLEGLMKASLGDFIIKGVTGEIYSCKPDIFRMTYEEVIDENCS